MSKIRFRMAAVFLVVAVAVSMLMPATVFAADTGATPGGTTVTVNDATELADAVANAGTTPATITIGAGFDISSPVTIPAGADITLDLGGQALTASVPFAFAVDGGSLTVTDSTVTDSTGGGLISSSADCVFCVYQGSLDLKAGEISSASSTAVRVYGSDDPAATDFSHVTIEGTANLTALYYGLLVGQRVAPAKPPKTVNAYGVVVDVKGGSISVGNYSLYVNGTVTGLGANAPTFNISGGTMGSIYAAGYAHWNISGGDIIGVPYDIDKDGSAPPNTDRPTGMTGIELKAGTLDMTGGSITATGPAGYFINPPGTSGTSTMAYGIAVANYSGYAGNIDVNISGGTITSDADGVAFGIINVTGTTPTKPVNVSISGGAFIGPVTVDNTVGDFTGFISGGTFSSNAGLSPDWIAPGSDITTVPYTYTMPAGSTSADLQAAIENFSGGIIDLDGQTITVTVLTVDKPVTIQNGTINYALVDGAISYINIVSSDVTLQNLTLIGVDSNGNAGCNNIMIGYGVGPNFSNINILNNKIIVGTDIVAPDGTLGYDYGRGIYGYASDVTISGNTISTTATAPRDPESLLPNVSNTPIYMDGAGTNVTISDNEITGYYDLPLRVDSVSNVTITGNDFSQTVCPFLMIDTGIPAYLSFIMISYNYANAPSVAVESNTFTGNGTDVQYAVAAKDSSYLTSFTGNTMENFPADSNGIQALYAVNGTFNPSLLTGNDPAYVVDSNGIGHFGDYDMPVADITGVPTTATAGTALTLTGTVAPADATNQDIVWAVQSAGTTGATVSGSTFKATAVGTAVVTATITDGIALGEDYTKNFTITVSAASLSAAVQNAINAINGLPASVASAADAAQVAAAAAAYNALSPTDQAQVPQAAKDKLAAAQASAKAFNTPAQVVAIRAAQTTFNVVKGKSLTIPYEADVAAGETKTPVFTWTSDAPQNVSVDNTGKVTGVVAGKSAKITVASDSGMTKIFTVKVAAKAVKATKISVSKPPKTMTVGQVKTLKVKLSPAKATGAVPSFKSSKSSVITVDKAGQLKAVAKGTAKITVKEGGKKIVITIKVK